MFVLFEGTTPLAEGSYPALAAQRETLTPVARGSALILNLATGDIAYGPDPAPPQSAPASAHSTADSVQMASLYCVGW